MIYIKDLTYLGGLLFLFSCSGKEESAASRKLKQDTLASYEANYQIVMLQ